MNDEKKIFLTLGIAAELIYVFIFCLYAFFLNDLNAHLTRKRNAFDIVSYNNFQAVWFVFLGLILAIVAVLSIFMLWKYTLSIVDFWDATYILPILATLVNIISVWVSWNLISVPILKAVFVVFVGGITVVYAISNNS